MIDKSKLFNLAMRTLGVVVLILELTNVVLDLYSKVVNYVAKVRKLQIFLYQER